MSRCQRFILPPSAKAFCCRETAKFVASVHNATRYSPWKWTEQLAVVHVTRANLSCYKATCNGEFRYVGGDSESALYECESCGAELEQSGVETLASDEGPVGQLARLLIKGGSQ